MPKTYILRCKDGRYYVGSTINLKQRFKDHLNKKCRFTKSRLPVKLVYTEEFLTLSQARKREKQIKSWKSRKRIEKLLKLALKAPSSNGSGH